MPVYFPPVEQADETGLLAVGGDLNVETLESAYRKGIFPWPAEGYPVLWFAPPTRAILAFDELRISKRLRRYLKNADFAFRINSDFRGVIQGCAAAKNRRRQRGTWITHDIIRAYFHLHEAGLAHSFEAWNPADHLVGGLYGVRIENYFAGESMFYREPNASKFVLIHTVEYLRSLGLTWMDVQIMSPLLKNFGAREIPRKKFMQWLQNALTEH